MIILGPKTAILGPQFCGILVLGPHLWWSGSPPGSVPDCTLFNILSLILKYLLHNLCCSSMNNHKNKCFTEGLQLREPKFAKIRQILPKNCRKTFD